MELRLVEFIAALRGAGVRVSLAESTDCFQAIKRVGTLDRQRFRSALRVTLVKEEQGLPIFDRLFPLYFGSGGPSLAKPAETLTSEEQEILQRVLAALDQTISRLLHWLLSGEPPAPSELQRLAEAAGLPRGFSEAPWVEHRMKRALGWGEVEKLLKQLLDALKAAGMGEEGLKRLREMAGQNLRALEEQVRRMIGAGISRRMTWEYQKTAGPDLLYRPFRQLSEHEAEELRRLVGRLVARLRTRAALRHRRGKKGLLDLKATLRANLRYGGVPIELRLRRRHLKPKLALLCDVSTSVRHCAEFMLRLIYELQDQVARARSFAFIDRLEEISQDFVEHRPEVAVRQVLRRLPPGHYNTDLGRCLSTFCQNYPDAVDSRTTVIFLGDGRNNYNNPRCDLLKAIGRRARRLIWMNPESTSLWGTGDSDMGSYLPLCHDVHEVGNLAQLAEAVDHLFLMTSR